MQKVIFWFAVIILATYGLGAGSAQANENQKGPKVRRTSTAALPMPVESSIALGRWIDLGNNTGYCKGKRGVCMIGTPILSAGSANYILQFPEINTSIEVVSYTAIEGQVPDGAGGTVEGTFISWTPVN